jgi:hypothetical protein
MKIDILSNIKYNQFKAYNCLKIPIINIEVIDLHENENFHLKKNPKLAN